MGPVAASSIASSIGPYAALFALLALSWAGFPVAGQAALVAAGVLASDGQLNVVAVLVGGSVASGLGGVAAYLIGLHGGRAAILAPGPLYGWRMRALAKGEQLFHRYGALAVFFAPMWLAGIHRMPWRRFLMWNALAAAAWTVAAGLGGYLVGPAITDVLKRGTIAVLAAIAVLASAALLYRWWTRRRARAAAPAGDGG